MSDHVFVEEKPMAGREHPLQPGAVIGREGCDIVLQDPEVSRRHAAIREGASGAAIEDLGSTNGTYVNDQRIEGLRELNDGDTVRFGNTVWRLQGAAGGATRIGDVPAQAEPTAVQAPAAPEPVAAPPPAPAAPTPEPVAAATGGDRRGDVPRPPDVAPSAIRRVLPPPEPGAGAAFNPAPSTSVRGSAATRVEATIFSFVVVALTAVGVVLFLILYEP